MPEAIAAITGISSSSATDLGRDLFFDCQGTRMMLNALYSGMNGIIAMKRFTCCEARICRHCQAALGPIGPRTGKAGWNHDIDHPKPPVKREKTVSL